MILKGNQRAGGQQLAQHLVNLRDNDFVSVHELRGFVSETLDGAFKEAQAISRGTKCKQYLFSLSLSPPQDQSVPVSVFEKAIEEIEADLSLTGQPRAVVFHEKNGRRHAHCVWSRIDIETMTAINLPYTKLRLRELSLQLYVDLGWNVPEGIVDSRLRDQNNFSHSVWQQANRLGRDPRAIKRILRECWNRSDSLQAFQGALQQRDYHLARGDRRGFVIVDHDGTAYAASRWLGVKSRELRERLGNPDDLSSMSEVRDYLIEKSTAQSHLSHKALKEQHQQELSQLGVERDKLVANQKAERMNLLQNQSDRLLEEAERRRMDFRTGLPGIWDRVTGLERKIKQRHTEDFRAAVDRDMYELDYLIGTHLTTQRQLHKKRQQCQTHYEEKLRDLRTFHNSRIRQLQNAELVNEPDLEPDI